MSRFFTCVCFVATICLLGSLTESTGVAQISSRTDVYNYPASSPPRNGIGSQSLFGLRNNANARLTNQMSVGSTTATGNLGPQAWRNQAPVYNLNQVPYVARSVVETSSRSPVEQQRSSTLSSRQSVSGQASQFTTAQQAQSQAIELARRAQYQQAQAQQTLAQAQQAQARAAQIAQASQPTTVYRQAVFQQPTLGLGAPQLRTVQNCSCVSASNSTVSAFRVPAQNSGLGLGATVPVAAPGSSPLTPLVNLQNMPAGTYVGQGIIGQPTAYRDGQPIRNLFRYITP